MNTNRIKREILQLGCTLAGLAIGQKKKAPVAGTVIGTSFGAVMGEVFFPEPPKKTTKA